MTSTFQCHYITKNRLCVTCRLLSWTVHLSKCTCTCVVDIFAGRESGWFWKPRWTSVSCSELSTASSRLVCCWTMHFVCHQSYMSQCWVLSACDSDVMINACVWQWYNDACFSGTRRAWTAWYQWQSDPTVSWSWRRWRFDRRPWPGSASGGQFQFQFHSQ